MHGRQNLVVHGRDPVEQLLAHSGFLALCERIRWAKDLWLGACVIMEPDARA